jgi:hypothetical protein
MQRSVQWEDFWSNIILYCIVLLLQQQFYMYNKLCFFWNWLANKMGWWIKVAAAVWLERQAVLLQNIIFVASESRLRTPRSGVQIPSGVRDFCFSEPPSPPLVLLQPPASWVPGLFSRRGIGRDEGDPSLSGTGVKNEGKRPSLSPLCAQKLCWENFTVTWDLRPSGIFRSLDWNPWRQDR